MAPPLESRRPCCAPLGFAFWSMIAVLAGLWREAARARTAEQRTQRPVGTELPAQPMAGEPEDRLMANSVRESIRNIPAARRWWRRAGRARNRVLGRPDAWADLLAVCRAIRPAAVLDMGAHVGRTVERFADELTAVPIHAFEPTPRSAAALRQRVRSRAFPT